MKTFKILLVLGAAGLIGGLLFIYSGVFNVAADDPHTKPFYWLMETVRERSIAVRARGLAVPPLKDPAMIIAGGADFNEMCTGCHLKPGVEDSELASAMYPRPPSLAKSTRDNPAEIEQTDFHEAPKDNPRRRDDLQCAHGKDDSKFSGAEPEKGHAEDPGGVGREVRLGGHEQVRREQGHCERWVHEPGTGQTRQKHRRSGEVDHVIDIKAVSRPLLPTHARHRSVEAIAKPVRDQRHDDAERGPRGDMKAGERNTGRQHRQERQGREVV